MLFHVKQVHTPENCPYGHGGSGSLFDATAPGTKLVGFYGSLMEHTLYLIVDADSIDALNKFLFPGMKSTICTITPVSDHGLPF